MDGRIAELRDELSRLHGPARVPKLVRLGQELARSHWRAGPGQPAALGELAAAIEVWDEAYALLDSGDPARGEVAFQLGWLLMARHGAHGGGVQDRETGISVLGEALTCTDLSPVKATAARLALGSLLLTRAVEALNPASARGGFLTGPPHGARADADAAIPLFRQVIDGPPLSAELTAMARTMLTLAESIEPLLSGDLARVDLSKMVEAMSALQRLQRDGLPSAPWISGDSLDYPVTVVHGDAHPTPTIPPRRPAPAADVTTATGAGEPYSARRAARDRLAALIADGELPVWKQARALLLADPAQVTAGDLNAFVAAAANAVDADEGDEPLESGLDRLLSAIGLCLRERRDGGGWGNEEAYGEEYHTGAQQLSAATALVPPDHPAATVLVEAVGGLLDESRPLSGAIVGIADSLYGYAGKIPSPPPVVTALAELCRTVAALRAGTATDPDALATALAAIPTSHPSRPALSTAVEHARLAAAVRLGEPITADRSFGDLAEVLDALLRDDPVALRAALDANAGRSSPRVSAILGAIHLRLTSDLDTSIALLSDAARLLDEDGLYTRTWWRLAEAYRARGVAGDADLSRDAGLKSLRGPDPDRRDAARFAGWMLAEGRGDDAFTALEVAAACPEPPVADPLVRDVLSVLVGVAPQPSPPPAPPSPTSVAASVREIGAAALLYLHPTDDAGRIVGVLCLDPATDRLDVLANLPVTDPLASDDPGWPAILRRWTSESLLVAATGSLGRLALSAVRTGDGRYLAQDVVVSHVSSGFQVIRLAARRFVPVDSEPLFVVNPRGDRNSEMAEVMTVRRVFYPRSVCLGRALEPVDGAGTPTDLFAHLPTASLLHLACGVQGTELELASHDVVDMAAVDSAAGLVILSETCAPALLDAGFAGVVGWHWAVPASFASLALFMLHLQLVEHRLPPVAAVNAVQRWMLNPDRILPPSLTGAHLNTVATTDLTEPALWAALAYHGR